MAGTSMYRDQGHNTAGTTEILIHMTAGATGAVSALKARGITSIVNDNTGLYSLFLDKPWYGVAGFSWGCLSSSAGKFYPQLTSEDVNNPAAASRKITIQFYDYDDDSAKDPDSGDIFFFKLTLHNSIGMGTALSCAADS